MTSFVVTALEAAGASPASADPSAATRSLIEFVHTGARQLGAHVATCSRHGAGVRAQLEDDAPEPARARAVRLRQAIAAAAAAAGHPLDLAVQPAELRRPPRLVVFDMDSTLITIEVIDELARRHGVGAEVAAVTERAMRGELDFEASLRARVQKLAGLPAAALEEVAAAIQLSPGAESLISAMQARGAAVAIASGGFSFAADLLRRRLGLVAAYSNQLELASGVVTGRVLGGVVTAERKAEVVRELALAGGCSPADAIAIGDGANDRLMLAAAGLGVAFHAKPALAQVADATIDHGGLERVLAMVD